jgi:hypothetical protein
MHTTNAQQGYRIMLSPDGHFSACCTPLEAVSHPGWTDCTDLSDEAFQRLISERQLESVRLVGVTVH